MRAATVFLLLGPVVHCFDGVTEPELDLRPNTYTKKTITPLDATVDSTLAERCGGKEGKLPAADSIVGGKPVQNESDERFPWAVAFFRSDPAASGERPYCTGTLVSDRHVMTAAHCVQTWGPNNEYEEAEWFPMERYYVVMGAKCVVSNGQCEALRARRTIRRIINAVIPMEMSSHPTKRRGGDIAIIELETPVLENATLKYACLPPATLDLPHTADYTEWGWGLLRHGTSQDPSPPASDTLNYLDGVTLDECTPKNSGMAVDLDVICGHSVGSNDGIEEGDSGSGFEWQRKGKGPNYVIGVSAYTLGNKANVGYMTDVRRYAKWLCEHTKICYMRRK
ncbi:unnamed protein product, partial [Mesorhabditis spiculigera]